ncbi:glucosaminidase domain-containing protein [Aliagarivorans taiwanensis]|uniref:glucosaminidase domain-containing protein n=1 Tax=Aliagarivorans taiwanensis TaxID=561966 RepID=UPI00054E7150|nr:glucosaminidase domain-containing protein [Aliagarivorans taiwanensis]
MESLVLLFKRTRFVAICLIPMFLFSCSEPHKPSVNKADAQVMGELPNFAAIEEVGEKKTQFFDYLRVGIDLENQRIEQERTELNAMREQLADGALSNPQLDKLVELAGRYKVSIDQEQVSITVIDELLNRVNVIPPALVLVQAANESAWGTSRFATEGNNLFGQWCYREGCGLVPLSRVEGMTHEVAKFDSVQHSIHAYFMNINTNRAYRAVREQRDLLVDAGDDLLGVEAAEAMSQGLRSYSERGEEYVLELQTMMRHNNRYL